MATTSSTHEPPFHVPLSRREGWRQAVASFYHKNDGHAMRGRPPHPRKLLSAKTVIALQRAPRLGNRRRTTAAEQLIFPTFLSGGKRRH